ncbi:MAG: hypothetical protein BM562_08555 [Alphaproteobacteria bacterium MedPE-SWcel]|nr:MAG: hypothetical protein BM562_08555 [Alphaproteobacteria bacterium MedPE-SWcel]
MDAQNQELVSQLWNEWQADRPFAGPNADEILMTLHFRAQMTFGGSIANARNSAFQGGYAQHAFRHIRPRTMAGAEFPRTRCL